jgi:hypothetical protein
MRPGLSPTDDETDMRAARLNQCTSCWTKSSLDENGGENASQSFIDQSHSTGRAVVVADAGLDRATVCREFRPDRAAAGPLGGTLA